MKWFPEIVPNSIPLMEKLNNLLFAAAEKNYIIMLLLHRLLLDENKNVR